MVKVVYGEKLSGDSLEDFYTIPLDREGGSTPKHVEYTDTETGYHLIMDGKNFTYGGGSFDGTVNTMKFVDDNNKALLTITGASYDGSDLLTAGINGFDALVEYALSGNDNLVGSKAADDILAGAGKDNIDGGKGNDIIEGGIGNDKIDGGDGSDHFMFTAGDGKDTISHFDAKGGGLKQDYIYVTSDIEAEVSFSKKGALLDFDNGDSIMLLGVKKADFSLADDVHTWELG